MKQHTIIDTDHCGSCGRSLQFERQHEGYEVAKCCGRTYSQMDVPVVKRAQSHGYTGPQCFTHSHTSSMSRILIDKDYDGGVHQAVGAESPGPNSMKGRPRI